MLLVIFVQSNKSSHWNNKTSWAFFSGIVQNLVWCGLLRVHMMTLLWRPIHWVSVFDFPLLLMLKDKSRFVNIKLHVYLMNNFRNFKKFYELLNSPRNVYRKSVQIFISFETEVTIFVEFSADLLPSSFVFCGFMFIVRTYLLDK